jgi:hypothetical protein
MKITWNDLSFLPSDEAIASLRRAWSWLLPDLFEPLMASTLGDVFFQQGSAGVYWLNTGTAEIHRVASTREEFLQLLKTDKANEWFMPGLIDKLKKAGKTLEPDDCYSYVILPIFKEGTFEVENFNPVPAEQHFEMTGEIHRQIHAIPDGQKVEIKIN